MVSSVRAARGLGIRFTQCSLLWCLRRNPEIHKMAYLASAICCISSIAGLSQVESSRMGNALGIVGVSTGLAATYGMLSPTPSVAAQMALLAGGGGLIGYRIASTVTPTELPQLVALFHSFVGLAASLTCMGTHYHEFAHFGHMADAGVHMNSIYAGTAIGAITFTGSLVAWGKLDERLDSAALDLPGKNLINLGCALANVPLYASYMGASSVGSGLGVLGATSVLWGGMGWHMTMSIGGADMPVVITVLNSYSGWALACEGFLLDNTLMTSVGACESRVTGCLRQLSARHVLCCAGTNGQSAAETRIPAEHAASFSCPHSHSCPQQCARVRTDLRRHSSVSPERSSRGSCAWR